MRRPVEIDNYLPTVLLGTLAALVRRDGPDLTARQFAVFLICYVEEGPHTVRGLSERTNLPKPAISRVLDRLGAVGLTRRVADPRDKRSVLIACTADGFALLKTVRGMLEEAARNAQHDGNSPPGHAANAGSG